MEAKIIAQSKKKQRDYKIIAKFLAGLVLTGNEIKSLRNYQSSINEAYIVPQQGELFILNMYITAYRYSHLSGLKKNLAKRKKKLLLKRREINKLIGQVKAKNFVLIPLQL